MADAAVSAGYGSFRALHRHRMLTVHCPSTTPDPAAGPAPADEGAEPLLQSSRERDERLMSGHGDGELRGRQGRERRVEETPIEMQAHCGGQGQEFLHILQTPQSLAHGVFGALQRTLHQQEGSLALAMRVLAIVQHFLQMRQIRRLGSSAAIGEQHPQAEQDGLNGLHAVILPKKRGCAAFARS